MNYSYSPDTAKVLLSILLGSIGLFLLLAISSYSPFDPGWTYTASDTKQISNLGGMIGAWFADLLRAGLGCASFLIPFYLFYEIWQLWKPRTVLPRVWRYFAQTFMIVMLASLIALFRSQHSLNYAGGVIGYEMSFAISKVFTIYGAGFIFILLLTLSCNLIFVINWQKIWFNTKLASDFMKDTLYRSQTKATTSKHHESSEQLSQHDTIFINKIHQDSILMTQDALPSDTPHHTNIYITGEVGQRANTAQTHLYEIQQLLAQSKIQQRAIVKEKELAQTPNIASPQANIQKTNWQNQQVFDAMLHQLDEQIQISSDTVYQKADTQDIDRRIHELHQQIEALQHAQSEILQQKYDDPSIHSNTITHQNSNYIVTEQLHHLSQDTGATIPETPTQHQTLNQSKIHQQINETETKPVKEPKKESKIQNLLDKVLTRRNKSTNIQGDNTDDIAMESLAIINESNIEAQAEAQKSNIENDFMLQHQQLQQRLKHNPLQDLEQMLMLANAGKHTKMVSTSRQPLATSVQDDIYTSAQQATQNQKKNNYQEISSLAQFNDNLNHSSSIRERIRSQLNEFNPSNDDIIPTKQDYSINISQNHSDIDWDTPLTDSHGRVISRAIQVAQHRKDLPTLPSLSLLDKVDINKKVNFSEEQLGYLSQLLELKLQDFNVKAQVKEVQPGPVVTRFALELAPGVKASKVTSIAQDLARSMSMSSIRVVQVIPGKPYIGIEVPNSTREIVRLIELVDTPEFRNPNALLSMAMGKDISGQPILTDLAKAPHMLVAGTTGSGKSVAVNSMLLSMLLKYTPQQLRLLLIDPKQLELANYDEIPHLLTPVVTDMKDATNALHWCVKEMERRYSLMTAFKVRKINDFNAKITQAIENGEDIIDPLWKPDNSVMERAPRLQPLPMIVIVADEFADMIMQVGKKAEEMITRLAQKSRAAGIHLLLATQRPSVDVITGLIKANIPTRVALRVNSKIDSRTILDAGGAEDLLGHGDMLFLAPGKNEPERLHGAFIADDEVNRICDAWRERGSPDYVDGILDSDEDDEKSSNAISFDDEQIQDVLYDKAVEFVLRTRKASASSLQRQFNIGFNRAANLMDAMERNGIVSESQGSNRREILI